MKNKKGCRKPIIFSGRFKLKSAKKDEDEFFLRLQLFKKAKLGSMKARRELRKKYNLTGIWDGEKVVNLREV